MIKMRNLSGILLSTLCAVALKADATRAEDKPTASPTPSASAAPQGTSQSTDLSPNEEEELKTTEPQNAAVPEEPIKSVPWVAPDFSKQDAAAGWTLHTFDTPPGFVRRVNFWIDIYTKYTTHQVLLHDAHYLDIVYRMLDFTKLDDDPNLSAVDKERTKKKQIKEAKKEVREQLLRIQQHEDDVETLSADDKDIFKKFRFVFERHKFSEAANRHRLRMQLGQKDRFALGVYFSGRYIREMEKIFKEEGVPVELTRLPFVESSFNLYAFSKVGASGIWQFMRSTGRLFHLKNDSFVDLRNDPLAATRAAAKLLKYNYTLLKSWPLALTAYNHGPQGVARIVKKLKTDDINQIVWNNNRHRFGFASENFYAEFLAALETESHAAKYFGDIQVSPPLIYDEVTLPRPVLFGEIALAMRTNSSDDGIERARLYNPFFSRQVIIGHRKIPQGVSIRVPKNYQEKFLAQLQNVDPTKVKLTLKNGTYRIMVGDTLSSISKDFGITLKALLEANNLSMRSRLRPGQKLIVPTLDDQPWKGQ